MKVVQQQQQAVGKAVGDAVNVARKNTPAARAMANLPKAATVGKEATEADKLAAKVASITRTTLKSVARTNDTVKAELAEEAEAARKAKEQDPEYLAARKKWLTKALQEVNALLKK